MPLRNRVLPNAEIVSMPMRGLLMGNRGCLHDDQKRVLKPWASNAWIICLLEFKGRKRELMKPGCYTELFFLDEASALAAGHRPCAECRREAFERFRTAWARGNDYRGGGALPRAGEMDDRLQQDRVEPGGRGKRIYEAALGDLPDGAMVLGLDGEPHLFAGNALRRWASDGYAEPVAADPKATVRVLTPRSTVAAMAAGYSAMLHPSATA